MIAGIFYQGSGLGNQLARYIFTRVKAKDLNIDFGMIDSHLFKGSSFMDLDMGVPVKNLLYEFNEEKVINEQGNDVRPYDINSEQIKNFTLVDGEFQDYKYFGHRLNEIREWLKVEPTYMPDDLCVINFRGGEYVGVKDLFLPQEYWDMAISKMREINPQMKFEVHTDDYLSARRFFPNMSVIADIGINWRSIRHAPYLILSNSSFAILPALLNEKAHIIAPKYWAGYNKGYWQLPQNNYKKFNYIHHNE